MSRCSPGCTLRTPTWCRWSRRPPSSGAPVISPLLRSVVGRDATDVDDVVTELVRARVLERRGADRWRFRHELLREVAAELAPPSLGRDLHARAARALVDAAAAVEPDWRVVASHFEQAWHYDEAVEAYQKASVNARRRGAVQKRRPA